MTKVQERLLLLMDEIKNICEKENLKYVLANETCATARKFNGFNAEEYAFYILMPLSHIKKLKDYVEKNSKDRVVESYSNNPYLKNFLFRYVDRGTLLIDGNSLEYYKHPGVAVTILPAREYPASKKVKGCENYLKYVYSTNRKSFTFVVAKKIMNKLFGKHKCYFYNNSLSDYMYYGRFKSLFGSFEKTAKYVENENFKASQNKYDGYRYVTSGNKIVKLPKDFFDSIDSVSFEDRSYNASNNYKKYLKDLFGENWRTYSVRKINGTENPFVIAELDLPYETYLSAIKNDKDSYFDIVKDRVNNRNWVSHKFNPAEKTAEYNFNCCRRSVDRIDIWCNLKDKREALKTAYDNKDIDALRNLLKNYLYKCEKYIKMDIGLYIDDEILKYAKLVWENSKRPKLADRIYDCTPDLYKNETVDQYFANRQK